MRGLWEDVRYGLRVLGKHPGFTAVAVFTLGLGIAANSTVFSWIDAVLLTPIPGARDGSSLVVMESVSSAGTVMSSARADVRDFQREMKLVAGLTGTHFTPFSVGEPDIAQHVWGETVLANYFDVLGVKPILGRTFRPEEDSESEGASPLAVISYRLWQQHFRADASVVGKPLRLNGLTLTLVGVTPPEFHGGFTGLRLDVWVPMTMLTKVGAQANWIIEDRRTRNIDMIARLKPGVTVEQAGAEAEAIAAHLAAAYPQSNRGIGAHVAPVWKGRNGAQRLLREPLLILMAVSVLVLLIACANVGNLLLARSVARQREFGIRVAMGAGQRRLMRQMLTEGLLLAAGGSVAGLLMSLWMTQSLLFLLPHTELPIGFDVAVNVRVIAFTALVCLTSTLVAASAPALYAARTNINETLKEGGRSGNAGSRSHGMRSVLVISEVALAAVATVAAGLFLRSFDNARAIHPGFDRANVMIARFYLSAAGYGTDQEKLFSRKLRERLAGAPGVEDVTYADWVPLSFGDPPWNEVEVDGYASTANEDLKVPRTLTAPGYFQLLRVPILAGRDFNELDDQEQAPVLIVNETFARRFFGGQDPVGRRVKFSGRWRRVIGMTKDFRDMPPGFPRHPYLFLPYQQGFGRGHSTYFYIRMKGDPAIAMTSLRRETAALDPSSGLYDMVPLQEMTEASLYSQKVAASLVGGLGVLSLLLAAIGLYSVMAYAVMERTQDIGIRMALGAEPGDVLGMVLRQGMKLLFAGLLAGAAAAAARAISGMLVNLSSLDPITFLAAAAFLAVVALTACYLPARRATKVDPITALRAQ